MKVAQISDKNKISINEFKTPSLNVGEILVKMRACGICGSDIEKIFGDYGMASKKIGHEPAGEIIDVGNDVTNFEIGERVFIHHHVGCMKCYYCQHGNNTMCEMYNKTNIEPCGLSENILVPAWNVQMGGVIKLPKSTTYELASLIEPLACCIRAINKCKPNIGDTVCVFGAGPTGLMHLILGQFMGIQKIILIDVNNYRLNFSKKFGADTINLMEEDMVTKIEKLTDGIGVDLSIIATSNTDAFSDALKITRKGGKILLFGVPDKKAYLNINLNTVYSREISIIPSYAATEIETNQAIRILKIYEEKFHSLITHRYNLNEISKAVDVARTADKAMKVIIIND